MKTLKIFAVILMGVLLIQSSSISQTKTKPVLKIGFQAAGALQTLQQSDNNNSYYDLPKAMQNPTGNLTFDIDLAPGVKVYFDLYLSSTHHVGAVYDHEGYVYISSLPEENNILGLNSILKYIDIKGGHFENDFGNMHLYRSDNADVQRNALVGNYIVDANTVAPSIEIITSFDSPLSFVAGYTSAVTTAKFKEGQGFGYYGKARLFKENSYDFSASFFNADHTDNGSGSRASLFSGNRSGGKYAAIWENNSEPGQVKPGKGQLVRATQLDGRYTIDNLVLSGLYGVAKDNDINGADEGIIKEEWKYYGIEGQYNFTSRFYGAARYNAATTDMYKGLESDGKIDRYQVGIGLWLLPEMLLKAEYVTQKATGFSQGLWQYNPKFSGLVFEMSIDF